MAGLVGYASSDEEDRDTSLDDQIGSENPLESTSGNGNSPGPSTPSHPSRTREPEPITTLPATTVSPSPSPSQSTPFVGPMPFPQTSSTQPTLPLPEPEEDPVSLIPPGSPYSSNRALLRALTHPTKPNLDLPPSPPGSPDPELSAKVAHFLSLKDRGTHFNAKLESSVAMRNPSLTDKLLAFAGVDEKAQYANTLPLDLWNPSGAPEWAYRTRLRKTQEKQRAEREAERASATRTAVDFVSASTSIGAGGSLPATSVAGGLSRREKKRKGWD